MATTNTRTCVSTPIAREELIERLIKGFKTPRRREDVEANEAAARIFLSGEEIDRRLGRYDSTWWPSAPGVEKLATMSVGT